MLEDNWKRKVAPAGRLQVAPRGSEGPLRSWRVAEPPPPDRRVSARQREQKEKTQVLFVGTRRERETDDRRIYHASSATAWGKVGEEDLPRFFIASSLKDYSAWSQCRIFGTLQILL